MICFLVDLRYSRLNNTKYSVTCKLSLILITLIVLISIYSKKK